MKVLVKPVVLDNEDEDHDVVAYCDNTSCGCHGSKGGCGTNTNCNGYVGDDEVDDLLF